MHKKKTFKSNAKRKIFWDRSYSVGLTHLDEQHKQLIEIINALIEDPNADYASEKIGEIITRGMKYAVEHFKAEEEYMESIQYPGLEVHRLEHKKFIEKIAEVSLLAMQKTEGATDLLPYLKTWFVHHILFTDKKYMKYKMRISSGS